jgi:hypothetical protein
MIVQFEHYDWLRALTEQPALMVVWAAFGVPLTLLLCLIPDIILRKIGLPLPGGLQRFFYTGGAITWLTGFVVMMVLLFSDISGIRMLLIWCLMYLFYSLFCIFYDRPLRKWMDSLAEQKEVKANNGGEEKPKRRKLKRNTPS